MIGYSPSRIDDEEKHKFQLALQNVREETRRECRQWLDKMSKVNKSCRLLLRNPRGTVATISSKKSSRCSIPTCSYYQNDNCVDVLVAICRTLMDSVIFILKDISPILCEVDAFVTDYRTKF